MVYLKGVNQPKYDTILEQILLNPDFEIFSSNIVVFN